MKTYLAFFSSILLITLLGLRAIVSSFSATYQGSDVRLEWRVSQEETVSFYEIYRKRNDDAAYTKIGRVANLNAGTYTFIDDNLYKTDEVQAGITYKLSIKHQDNSVNNYFTTINANPTAIQRSWGSIKSMFR